MANYRSGIMPMHQVHKPPFTIDSPGYEKVPGETIPRRHPSAKNGLISRPHDDIHTVYDIVRRSARLYPNHRAVGSRKLIKLHKEMKKIQKNVDGQVKEVEKEWRFYELSEYSFLTFKEYETLVLQVGSGLRKLGLTPEHKLHLFGATRYVISHCDSYNYCWSPVESCSLKFSVQTGSPCPTLAPLNPSP